MYFFLFYTKLRTPLTLGSFDIKLKNRLLVSTKDLVFNYVRFIIGTKVSNPTPLSVDIVSKFQVRETYYVSMYGVSNNLYSFLPPPGKM